MHQDLNRASTGSRQPVEDEIVSELLPDDFDWQRLVCTYPKSSLLLAGLGGYLLGRRRGTFIMAALAAFLTSRVESSVQQLLGDH